MLADHFRLSSSHQSALKRLSLETEEDLLRYFPSRYEGKATASLIRDLKVGETVILTGEVTKVKIGRGFKTRLPIGEVTITDTTGSIKAIWFHQVYLAKKVAVGQLASFKGKVAERRGLPRQGRGELYLTNPEIEPLERLPDHGGSLFADEGNTGSPSTLQPIYPETKNLSSNWIYHAVKKLIRLGLIDKLVDPIPDEILKRYHLPTLATALIWIHSPRTEADAVAARKRFAFEEIFLIQLDRAKRRADYRSQAAHPVVSSREETQTFIKQLSFPLTLAQARAVQAILKDMEGKQPMARLLEGDVGSGKTAVAAIAAYATVLSGAEVAYMAPTEILAKQQFESFIKNFAHLGINIGLLTGGECRKFPSKIPARIERDSMHSGKHPKTHTDISRSQLLKWVANGEIPILIGTQTLIQKTVKWKKLALTIIDEQHRFGVMQRKKLVAQGKEARHAAVPHLLSMTATPIPRTLALTIYGDLDLTLLDELPPGRRPVTTEVVTEKTRGVTYEKIRRELKAGRQAYIICPRIDPPDITKADSLIVKSAKAEYERLAKEVFPDFNLGLLHGKLKPDDKEAVMEDFADGKIDILVSTSVVEVGVNVPNATMIVIEGAERFGLAQLHQLRGRVARSSEQAYCYLFTTGENSPPRLDYLTSAKNGFALAEYDLSLRGAGSLGGGKQWGISDIGMEAIKNLKMVEAARAEAHELIKQDPELSKYPLLVTRLEAITRRNIHFE